MKRLVGTAFAAPMISSFTMSGIGAVFGDSTGSLVGAVAPNTSPTKRSDYPTGIGCLRLTQANVGNIAQFNDGPRNIKLTVPNSAFRRPTTVCVYRGNLTALADDVPSGETPVSAYSVVWTDEANQRPNASAPLSLEVTDPVVASGDPIYMVDSGSPVNQGAASTGVWGTTFTIDPHYVVTQVDPPDEPPVDPPAAGAADAVVTEPRTTG